MNYIKYPQWEPLPHELQHLENYASYILRELGLVPQNGSATYRQSAILSWMVYGPSRQITVGFRGIAKSTMVAIYNSWRLRMDPVEEKCLITGSTAEKAVEISTQLLEWFDVIDILRCLHPRRDQRQSAQRGFDVGPCPKGHSQSPSCRPSGILSSGLTGKRCSIATADDTETLSNSITPHKQARIAHACSELEQILLPEKGQLLPRQILYLGTPHVETSLYLELVRKFGYAIRYWPARYPDPFNEESIACYEGNLDPEILREATEDPSLVGAPTDPERFGEEELQVREAKNSRVTWLMQYQLNCRLSTEQRYPIRLGDLIVMDLDGKALPETVTWGNASDMILRDLVCTGLGSDRWYYGPGVVQRWISKLDRWNCVMGIDPSGRGHDELAWAVCAELNGNIFLLECGGTQLGYADESLERLARVAARWDVGLCLPEANYGGGMFAAALTKVMNRIHPCTIEEVPSGNQQKERRLVDSLAPAIQQHRLVVSRELLRSDYLEAERDPESGHERSLAFQLSRLTTERGALSWYDRIDALSYCVSHFTLAVAQDQEKAALQREGEEAEAVIEEFFLNAEGSADRLALGLRPRSLVRQPGAGRAVLGLPPPPAGSKFGRAEGGVSRLTV